MSPTALSDLAGRLIALEGACGDPPAANVASRVCARLRAPLSRLAGVAGYRSLLARALALARAGDDSLHAVRLRADGTLEGLDAGGEGIAAHLLGLIVTFIGEPLTRQLVSEAWPAWGERAGGQP